MAGSSDGARTPLRITRLDRASVSFETQGIPGQQRGTNNSTIAGFGTLTVVESTV